MTKAFLVYSKQAMANSIVWTSGSQSSTPFGNFLQPNDNRPTLVVAASIDEAAERFKNASKIEELDVKEIIVSEKVDILLKRS